MGYFEKQNKQKHLLNGSDVWSMSRKVELLDIFFKKECRLREHANISIMIVRVK